MSSPRTLSLLQDYSNENQSARANSPSHEDLQLAAAIGKKLVNENQTIKEQLSLARSVAEGEKTALEGRVNKLWKRCMELEQENVLLNGKRGEEVTKPKTKENHELQAARSLVQQLQW
jgi:hypothetical protein